MSPCHPDSTWSRASQCSLLAPHLALLWRSGTSPQECEVDQPTRWTWEEFRQLPSEEITTDIHCVTKWSKLGTKWEGVSVDTLLEGVETSAEYVTAFCDGGYTTNVPLEEVTGGKAWVSRKRTPGAVSDPANTPPGRNTRHASASS